MITSTRIADNLTLTTHIKDSSFCHQEMSPLKKGKLGARDYDAETDSCLKYNSVATSNFQGNYHSLSFANFVFVIPKNDIIQLKAFLL